MKLLAFLGLTILPLAGQVVFTDTFNAPDGAIDSDLEQRQSGGALRLSWIPVPVTGQTMAPAASLSGNKAIFSHAYTGTSATNGDTHTVWTPSLNGTDPYDFSSHLANRDWNLTFAAAATGAHTTDRLRVVMQNEVVPSIADSATDLGWQLSKGPGDSTMPGTGVKLLSDGTKINWPDATTASDATSERTYSISMSEPGAYQYTSSVNGSPFPTGIGNVTGFSTSTRFLYIHLLDRQVSTASPATLVGTLDSIELSVSGSAPSYPSITSFSATPDMIPSGGTSTLSWSVDNTDSLSISPGIGTVSGNSIAVSPTETTTYTLTATNSQGSRTAQTTIAIQPLIKPNFLFIAIDDLKPIIGALGDNPGNFLNRIYPNPVKRAEIRQILTPNIDRLAAMGINFHKAYCPQSVCRPSRTALMTGYRPLESGVTSNAHGYFRNPDKPLELRKATTLPKHLGNHGYYSTGCGKIIHGPDDLETDWTGTTIDGVFYNSWDMWFDSSPNPVAQGASVMSAYAPSQLGTGSVFDFGYHNGPMEGQKDFRTASFLAGLFESPTRTITHNGRTATLPSDRNFFIACGISKPHLAFYAPKDTLDLFDVDDIQLSQETLDFFEADLNDIVSTASLTSGDIGDILKEDPSVGKLGGIPAYKETVRHYLAACAVADRSVGRILDALEASPYAGNTVVVLWSDHGWYLGEKLRFGKTQLWDESANCVLIIRDPRPGMQAAAGTPCYRPVTLQDLYPTISSLAGAPKPAHVKGYDISPLIRNPDRTWNVPAQTNSSAEVAIRIGRWSYLERNTSKELYDVANDPDEINNLIDNPAYAAIRSQMETMMNRSKANDPFDDRHLGDYESWRMGKTGWFVDEPISLSPELDPDGDTASNLTEYYFGTDPFRSDFDKISPGSRVSEDQIGIRFRMRDDDPSLRYRVMKSTDLGASNPWSPIWSSETPAAIQENTVTTIAPGLREMEVFDGMNSPKGFLRIELTDD